MAALRSVQNFNETNFNLCFDNYQLISKLYVCSDNYHKSKGLSIIHLNVRSIIGKMFLIKLICDIYKPDFLCLTESWLNSSHTNIEIAINNNRIHRKDRINDRRGGGIIVYEKMDSNFICNEIDVNIENIDIEFMSFKVKQNLSKPLLLSVLYCPPSHTNQVNEDLISKFGDNLRNEIIIIGDINIDANNKLNEKWFESIENNGFTQLIKSFTRITDTSKSIIDHIYTNEAMNISDSGVLDFDV